MDLKKLASDIKTASTVTKIAGGNTGDLDKAANVVGELSDMDEAIHSKGTTEEKAAWVINAGLEINASVGGKEVDMNRVATIAGGVIGVTDTLNIEESDFEKAGTVINEVNSVNKSLGNHTEPLEKAAKAASDLSELNKAYKEIINSDGPAVNKAVNTVAAVSNASKVISAKETKVGFWANLLSKFLKRN